MNKLRWPFFCGAVLAVVMTVATPAHADPMEGCDPAIWENMKATAAARALYDEAVMKEIMKQKPDSVLAMTCFNQYAGIEAETAAATFSGSFKDKAQEIVGPALQAHYKNYKSDTSPPDPHDALGASSGAVNYGTDATTLVSDNVDCPATENLWTHIQESGITDPETVPHLTYAEFVDARRLSRSQMRSRGWGDAFIETILANRDILDAAAEAQANVPKPSSTNLQGDRTCELFGNC